MTSHMQSEQPAPYRVAPAMMSDDQIIARALYLLERRFTKGAALSSPGAVRDWLRLCMADLEHEEFHAFWLDSQNRVIAPERLSRGTLTQTSVYPREVVKSALKHNAAAVIFAHNHPSGVSDPSSADEMLTRLLKDALDLVGVKVLDHFVVGSHECVSFAERGLL